ncbi:MAG: META domain-containing protein [Micromonosporaceae bacterium]
MKPKLILALLTLAVAGGCGQQPSPPAGPAPEQLPVGKTYLSTEVAEDGKARELASGTRIRIEFTRDGLRADAGCNHLMGKASLDSGRLSVDNLGGTEMGCEKPLMDQDKWLADFLTDSPVWKLDGDTLVLSDGITKIKLREEKQTAKPLTGTKWTLNTLVDGETAGSLPQGVKAHLTFGKDGKVSGNAGCNGFGGSYTVKGEKITFSNLGVTRMACGGDKDTVEKSVLAVLDGTVTYQVKGEVLTLTHPSGKGLQFTAG